MRLELVLDVHGRVSASTLAQPAVASVPLPAVLLSADLEAAAMLAGTGARAAWAASTRVAGCRSLGSDSLANTSQPGAAMGGVARRHGAPEFRGLPSASRGLFSEPIRGSPR